jgi:hypothetical protein
MAKIRGLKPDTVQTVTYRCPECEDYLNEFLMLLQNAKSLHPDPFEGLNIFLKTDEFLQAEDCTYRRCRTYTLRDCGKEITFLWKKAVVDRFTINC